MRSTMWAVLAARAGPILFRAVGITELMFAR
jgi:hypothetical protein